MPFPGISSFSDRILARFQGYSVKYLLSFFKSYPFFKSLNVLRKTVETGLDPRLKSVHSVCYVSVISAAYNSKKLALMIRDQNSSTMFNIGVPLYVIKKN